MASEKVNPSCLVFFEENEKPRQYVIFHHMTLKGQCDMEVFTTQSLQLTYPYLDREQCEIFIEKGKWIFRNLSSDVYTVVCGKTLKKGEAAELKDGGVIRLANGRMLTAIFFEKFVTGTEWQVIDMDDGRHSVEIWDTALKADEPAVRLQYEDSIWTLQEIQNKDVLINGADVDDFAAIQVDDCIQIRETKFVFAGGGLVYGYPFRESGLSIQIDERSAHKALKKITLLKDINLSIEPGNMVLILGGSGAGKSTFVNAVTGYEKAKATITEGDLDYYRDYKQVIHRIGMVPQENLMREDDTVGDTIRNAADMRLPRDMPDSAREKRIAAVLETFGLTGREKDLVTKLSGGQKKRLSICTEFIADPSVFILDEPDSGLDGIMATELMENLRMIACQGRIVMVITHSPDRVAHLFDKVIVLAKESETHIGQLAFYGGIQEARDFFGTDTMENIVKRINAENEGGEGRADEFIEKYDRYEKEREEVVRSVFSETREKEIPPAGSSGTEADSEDSDEAEKKEYKNRREQIPVYVGKQFRLLFTEKNWKVLPMAALIAALVVYVLGDRMFRNMEYTKYGSLALICVCIWNGMFNSIQAVCKERSIIKREHRAGLYISSYLASHMLFQAVICFFQVIISLLIFWIFGMYFPRTGLLTGSFALDVGITMFLVTYAADMMALMVSCIARTTTAAMTIMPFLLVVQLVFAGGVFPLQRPGSRIISNYTISNWGINAVNIAADYNSQNSVVLYTAVEKMDGEGDEMMAKIHDVLEIEELRDRMEKYTASRLQEPKFAYEKKNLLKAWGILALFAAIYALVGMAFLELIDRDKR